MALLDSLDDPDKQALLAAGLSMLAPKQQRTSLLGDIGSSGLLGLQTLLQGKQQERTNRASDLQQLTGLQSALYANEFPRMLQMGKAYTPGPDMQMVNSRINDLVAKMNLSGGRSAASISPPVASPVQAAPPAVPGVAAPSAAPMADPNYQPPSAAVRPDSATPAPAMSQGAPQAADGTMPSSVYGIPAPLFMAAGRAGPGALALLQEMAKSRAPQTNRPGATQTVWDEATQSVKPIFYSPKFAEGIQPSFGPNGQVTAGQVPGYAGAVSGIDAAKTGAVEAAKAPYSFQTVETASGAKLPMSIQQLMAGRGGPQPGGLPFISPQGSPGVAKVTVTEPSQQAQAVPQDPWKTVPVINSPTGLGQSTYAAALDKQRADKVTKLSDQFGAEADVGGQRVAQNNQALDMLNNADTGWLANHIGQFRSVLGTLGVKSAADKAATDQVLAKDLIGTALTKGKQLFGSRFTQSEVGIMLNQASASPAMMDTAIKFLLQTDNAGQQYNIQRGNDFGKYLNAHGDPMLFNQWYAQQFPLTKSYEGITLGTKAAPSDTPQSNGWTVRRLN